MNVFCLAISVRTKSFYCFSNPRMHNRTSSTNLSPPGKGSLKCELLDLFADSRGRLRQIPRMAVRRLREEVSVGFNHGHYC